MNNTSSSPVEIKDFTNSKRTKRFDSAGTPESPFRFLLSNLFKKKRGSLSLIHI